MTGILQWNVLVNPGNDLSHVDEALEKTGGSFIAVDREWRITRVNSSGVELAGADPAELLDRNVWDALPHLAGTEVEDAFHRAVEDEAPQHVTLSGPGAGEWHEFTVVPSGSGVFAFGRDVTQLRRAEARIHEQNETFQVVSENAVDALFLMDEAGRVKFANPAARAIFGWEPDELIGQVLHDVLHHHRADGTPFPMSECPIGGVYRTGGAMQGHEDIFFRKDGSPVHVVCSNGPVTDKSGNIIAAVLVVQDATEQRKAREEIASRERRLSALFGQAAVGMAQVDLPTGMIIEANNKLRDLLGYAAGELRGKTFREITHPDDVALEKKAVAELLSRARSSYAVEVRYVHKTGEPVWVRVTSSVASGGTHEDSYRITIVEDIRERKLAEEALSRLNKELIQARDAARQASHAKSTFLANMSHELRTPLSAICGYAEMIIEGADTTSPEDLREDAQRILLSGRHLTSIIGEILDLTKIEANRLELSLEEFDVAELLSEAGEIVQPQAALNGNQLLINCSPAAGTARADRVRVRQILVNLLSNAAKFTQDGTISVECRPVTRNNCPFLSIAVRDTGVGMTSDQQSMLFQRFHQVDASATRRRGGTGLGLAVSRELAHLMGGEITVESIFGHGSTFTLLLPRTVEAPAGVSGTGI